MSLCTLCGEMRQEAVKKETRRLCQSANAANYCGLCRNLDSLDEEIERVRCTLSDLLSQRVALQSQSNTTHPSFIHRLPVEVSSHIFTLYTSSATVSNTSTVSPFALGAVCRKWREIAWSTPSVWTNLAINASGTHMPWSFLQLVREWLTRSGQLPLSINLLLDTVEELLSEIEELNPLIDIINSHSDRWYSLKVTARPKVLSRLEDSSCLSPILHELDFSTEELEKFDEINEVDLKLTRVKPRLVRLDAENVWDLFVFDWAQVTDVTLKVVSADQVLKIFQVAPALRRCRFDTVSHLETDAEDYILHTAIESLCAMDSGVIKHLLNYITLSALKFLRIGDEKGDLEPVDSFVSFLERSRPANLKGLEIGNLLCTGEDLVRIVQITPQVENLQLDLKPAQDGSLEDFFDALQIPSHQSTTDLLLPALRTFSSSRHANFPWHVLPALLVSVNGRRRPLQEVTIICRCDSHLVESIPYIDQSLLSELDNFTHEVRFDFRAIRDGEHYNLWGPSPAKVSEASLNLA